MKVCPPSDSRSVIFLGPIRARWRAREPIKRVPKFYIFLRPISRSIPTRVCMGNIFYSFLQIFIINRNLQNRPGEKSHFFPTCLAILPCARHKRREGGKRAFERGPTQNEFFPQVRFRFSYCNFFGLHIPTGQCITKWCGPTSSTPGRNFVTARARARAREPIEVLSVFFDRFPGRFRQGCALGNCAPRPVLGP